MCYLDFAIVILAIDLPGDFFGLLSIAADDGELVLALLAVPDGIFTAEIHRDAHFAGVGWDFDGGQRDNPQYNPEPIFKTAHGDGGNPLDRSTRVQSIIQVIVLGLRGRAGQAFFGVVMSRALLVPRPRAGGWMESLESRQMLSQSHLQIIPTFDASIRSNPQAATIEATINTAIRQYESDYSTPIKVKIYFE